jgi:hypothetical protein
MLSNEKYEEIAQDTDHPLHFLWYAITENVEGNALATNETSFAERKEDFLNALQRLIADGRIKLHRNGVIWEDPVSMQIEAFRNAWPGSELHSGYSDFYWWFLDSACPAGIAWRRQDGTYAIAD